MNTKFLKILIVLKYLVYGELSNRNRHRIFLHMLQHLTEAVCQTCGVVGSKFNNRIWMLLLISN